MNLNTIKPNKKKAIFLAKRQIAELVYDAVNLEGINFTLPEVQTLLDGVTVGGHKLSDVTITLNQKKAWEYLFQALEKDFFSTRKDFACKLHAIAGAEEALEWGKFRTGKVTIAGTSFKPPAAEQLNTAWDTMISEAAKLENTFEKATFIFLQMARNQFFYDVNKRMGRFMMNGILLNAGYPAINVPAKEKLTFNKLMLEFYPNNNIKPMHEFLLACLDENTIEIMSEK